MPPTPYPELNDVLQMLVENVQTILEANFVAACLQGSFAVGDFDEHSDVDFLIVVEEELSPAQVDALQAMHLRLFDLECAWAQHLEGSYIPRSILKDYTQRGQPLWYLDHGSKQLVRSDHCNTVVVRWVVREHGVALAGTAPAFLVAPIPAAVLRQEILQTMQEWGQVILARPQEFSNLWYQTYIVLNFCRMLHDLHNGYPGSKRAGAEWAKRTLDPSWVDLIEHAWKGRPDPAFTCRQPADPTDFRRTLEFLQCILQASQEYTVQGL